MPVSRKISLILSVILRNRVTKDLLFCDCQTKKKQILRLRLRMTLWYISAEIADVEWIL